MNNRKVAIVGQGYVGLPLSMAAAKAGWQVTGVDASPEVVNSLRRGVSHIEDVPDDLLIDNLKSGLYSVSTEASVVRDSEICVLAVPTPLKPDRQPNLDYLEKAIRDIAEFLPSNALLISESTSFPGTLRELVLPLARELRSDQAKNLRFAAAPERVDPKNRDWTLQNTPRLISGIDVPSTIKAREFYSSFCDSVFIVSSPEVAEMSKLLENTFRQVNIALINQLAILCEKLGIDIREVVEAAGTKPYGFMKFYPGAGVGGHCIPIDPLYLKWKASKIGFDMTFISEADKVNNEMPQYVAERFVNIAKLRKKSKVAIFGVAYKSGISDTRESPAEAVALKLQDLGCEVFWHDPMVKNFMNLPPLGDSQLDGAIIVTAQEGLPINDLVNRGVPVFDCTGKYKELEGVFLL